MSKLTKAEFSLAVERKKSAVDLSYVECCILVAEELDIDPDNIPDLIYPTLKDKMREEAITNRVLRLPPQQTLDFLM